VLSQPGFGGRVSAVLQQLAMTAPLTLQGRLVLVGGGEGEGVLGHDGPSGQMAADAVLAGGEYGIALGLP
jgi:hypothetical protein